MIGVVLVICVGAAIVAQWWWKRRKWMALVADIPSYRGCSRIFGHALTLASTNTYDGVKVQQGRNILNESENFTYYTLLGAVDILKGASMEAVKNGGITTIWILSLPHYIITDPTDAMMVLNTCLNKSYVYSFLESWLGQGLLTARYNTWVHHRRLISPSFSPVVLNTFQGIFNRQARKLANAIAEQATDKPYDATYIMNLTFLETVCETALGVPLDIKTKSVKQYMSAIHTQMEMVIKRVFNVIYHPDIIYNFTVFKKIQYEAIDIILNYSRKVIALRKADFQNSAHKIPKENDQVDSSNKFKPFLQLLLELIEKKKDVMSDEQLREEVDTMILAGQETSALVLIYISAVLGTYQNIQDKVYEEIYEIFGDSDRDVVKDDLHRMTYTEAVINETMRLYPIAGFVAREIHTDLKLRNHTLPAGGSAFISFWAMHRLPCWGPDAEEFRPERWLEPDKLPDLNSTYGSFSLGKRMCLGKNYAMMSLKTSIVHLLRKCKITADISKIKLTCDMMLRPYTGHEFTVEPRK